MRPLVIVSVLNLLLEWKTLVQKVTGWEKNYFRSNSLLLYGKVNPSVMIGSFSVGILPHGPFPRKRSKSCIFFFFFSFSKAGKFN